MPRAHSWPPHANPRGLPGTLQVHWTVGCAAMHQPCGPNRSAHSRLPPMEPLGWQYGSMGRPCCFGGLPARVREQRRAGAVGQACEGMAAALRLPTTPAHLAAPLAAPVPAHRWCWRGSSTRLSAHRTRLRRSRGQGTVEAQQARGLAAFRQAPASHTSPAPAQWDRGSNPSHWPPQEGGWRPRSNPWSAHLAVQWRGMGCRQLKLVQPAGQVHSPESELHTPTCTQGIGGAAGRAGCSTWQGAWQRRRATGRPAAQWTATHQVAIQAAGLVAARCWPRWHWRLCKVVGTPAAARALAAPPHVRGCCAAAMGAGALRRCIPSRCGSAEPQEHAAGDKSGQQQQRKAAGPPPWPLQRHAATGSLGLFIPWTRSVPQACLSDCQAATSVEGWVRAWAAAGGSGQRQRWQALPAQDVLWMSTSSALPSLCDQAAVAPARFALGPGKLEWTHKPVPRLVLKECVLH